MRATGTSTRSSAFAAPDARPSGARLLWLDLARTLALLGMIVFHGAWDLELFGVLPSGTMAQDGWTGFASAIAGSFIFLSGVSLVIAHGHGFRRKSWLKRLGVIAVAALLVSGATYVAFPERYIYFGILHCIAASSLIGAGLLRAPAWGLFALAFAVLAVSEIWGARLLASHALAWTGLALPARPSLDFLPLVPWMAAFLAGMGFAKACPVRAHDLPIRSGSAARWLTSLTWPGRHSLTVYLLHQPVLLAILWAGLALAG